MVKVFFAGAIFGAYAGAYAGYRLNYNLYDWTKDHLLALLRFLHVIKKVS